MPKRREVGTATGWMAAFERARADGDRAREVKARDELRRLGVEIVGNESGGSVLWGASAMARRLGVKPGWLADEAEAGRVPGVRAGTTWLFDPEAVESVLLAKAREPATPKPTAPPEGVDQSRLLKLDEAADYFAVPPEWLLAQAKAKRIRSHHVTGPRTFDQAELREDLATLELMVPPNPAPELPRFLSRDRSFEIGVEFDLLLSCLRRGWPEEALAPLRRLEELGVRVIFTRMARPVGEVLKGGLE